MSQQVNRRPVAVGKEAATVDGGGGARQIMAEGGGGARQKVSDGGGRQRRRFPTAAR